MSWGGTNPDSAAAHEARASQPLGGRLIRMITKFAEGIDTSVKDFGDKHGMEPKATSEFHANHIRLPMPGTATDVLQGSLPGTDRQGELAWLKFSSMVDMEKNYIAVVVDTGRDLPSAWIDAEDVTIPGFGEGISERALELAKAGTLRGVDRRQEGLRLLQEQLARATGPAATRSRRSCPGRSSSRTRWHERRRGHRAQAGADGSSSDRPKRRRGARGRGHLCGRERGAAEPLPPGAGRSVRDPRGVDAGSDRRWA